VGDGSLRNLIFYTARSRFMENKSAGSRVPKTPVYTAISGMDGQQMHNKILLRLPHTECEVLFPELEYVLMRTHDVLHEAGQTITHAYFLNDGLASVLNVMADGKSVEVGLAGKEGFIGLPLLVGLSSSPNRVVAQVTGSAFRIRASDFVQSIRRCPQLGQTLNRFTHTMAMQSAQVAACNRVHEVGARLARWLLMSQDRLGSARIPLTQESLAAMLGTRRSSVTVAAGVLQKAGMIRYQRGEVNVVNRTELENASCECYQSMVRQSKIWEQELSAKTVPYRSRNAIRISALDLGK
jgi:CRP-like cAMP-binding protein